MVLTQDVNLPTEAELTVEEEFMLWSEREDPRKCINEGKMVTACTLEFFRKVKRNCFDEFNQYALCIDKSSGDFGLKHCRVTQGVFDKCMLDKMCLERPDYGYFCRARVHATTSELDCLPTLVFPGPEGWERNHLLPWLSFCYIEF
ncbi:NADH dehydrogenase 1 alpha subcomplex subunit 8 [Eumeta japonica]|uniref:NADH dehydrogenase 1 alpha subcomplex subunit 8 n=1 Tax=Eumeta variegata TaxID=151549 RepID=A0A4C1ZTE7_EUMVA|nr:NADH dehydrogenase 1 alpha subcomplex subunit 8 [Eumeta japonica]